MPQSILLGGPPHEVDLGELLHTWFMKRGGVGGQWRLRVTKRDDDTAVVAEVQQWFEQHKPPGKALPSSCRL
ncbi:hypothetical protein [Amycolatopsis sp. NPDC059021]|uniref:hypothetical protein n=1 Tax=Amycolatopsis sp. NPDC059021 TaxID=3346704 RepID=UPI003673606A